MKINVAGRQVEPLVLLLVVANVWIAVTLATVALTIWALVCIGIGLVNLPMTLLRRKGRA